MTDFRTLPAVNEILEDESVEALCRVAGRPTVLSWIRLELDRLRQQPESLSPTRPENSARVIQGVLNQGKAQSAVRLGRVINATGVILHTGLGRAPVSPEAVAAIGDMATAGNVEVDLRTGERRYRGHQLQPLWQQLTGCEDSLIVNNNAAATLLTLQALCAGREVVISRGQLIEIGGSFRLPEIFELSGARLREVGTTNRTKLSDYSNAVGPDTAAIMHVHPSNYRVVGFSQTPPIGELADLARQRNLIAIDDIGSGSMVDVRKYGLPEEPSFADSIGAGADVVLGSGDKLLGGPQAGIVIGRTALVERIRSAPFARTVRVDKLTLAALNATLESYARGDHERQVPVLRLLAATLDELRSRADNLADAVRAECPADVVDVVTPVGGGSLPGAEMPSVAVVLSPANIGLNDFSSRLRCGNPRVFSRVQNDQVVIDLRSVLPEDDADIATAVRSAAAADV